MSIFNLQSLLAKQPAVTAGRPVVSEFSLFVYHKREKGSTIEHLYACCSQDTSSRAPTGSPRTSNRSAAANVANAMPQSGKRPHVFVTTVTLCFCLNPACRYSAGQTSEGVLANFFNSLLTKKSGTGATGTPGGGNNTPGTVRKSGEKSHLDYESSYSSLDVTCHCHACFCLLIPHCSTSVLLSHL